MSYVMHIQCWIPVKRAKGAEDHRPYPHLSTTRSLDFGQCYSYVNLPGIIHALQILAP